jgi:hypothetical protein
LLAAAAEGAALFGESLPPPPAWERPTTSTAARAAQPIAIQIRRTVIG